MGHITPKMQTISLIADSIEKIRSNTGSVAVFIRNSSKSDADSSSLKIC